MRQWLAALAALALALTPGVARAATSSGTATAAATTTAAPSTAAAATTTADPSSVASSTTTAASSTTATTSTTASSTTTATTPTTTTTAKTTAAAHHAKKHKATKPLSGWLSDSPAFPRRALVLRSPTATPLVAGHLHVTENGTPVSPVSLTPVTSPGPDDLGIVVAVDENSSMEQSLPSAFAAIQSLAGARPTSEQLGVVNFDSQALAILPPTADAQTIGNILAETPEAGSGADVSAGTDLAVSQLRRARLAVGVAVVISDGVGISASAADAAQVRAAAAQAHVAVLTIGLRDSDATATSLGALKSWAPGTFTTATPAQLSAVLTSSLNRLIGRDEVARYRSAAAAGASVDVSATVTGLPGAVSASYTAPQAAAPATQPTRHVSHARHRPQSAAARALAQAGALLPTPSFGGAQPAAAVTPAAGFWSTGRAVLVVALVVALLIGAALAFALRRPVQRAVRSRVGSYMPADVAATDGGLHPEEHGPSLMRSLRAGTWWSHFTEAVEISRNPRPAGYLMKRAAIVALVVAALLVIVSHKVILGFLPILAFPFVERWWVMRAARQQRVKFGDTLPSYMQDMASAIRVGRSFVSAMAIVADSAEEPTRSELERAVTDESLGRPLDESLSAVGRRMQSADMDQLALIAELNRRSGSNVAEALDRVAEGARDRADLRREMRALTAQSKMSSSVLTGMPFVLLLGLSVIAPEYSHPLFHTTYGWVALIIALILILTGWKVMKSLSDIGV